MSELSASFIAFSCMRILSVAFDNESIKEKLPDINLMMRMPSIQMSLALVTGLSSLSRSSGA